MSLSVAELTKMMASKTDQELYGVLYSHPEEYTAEAIEVAKQEFSSRKLDALTLTSLSIAVEAQKDNEEARLGWRLRIVAFFISTLFFGIPVILAHRHFVEKGARRKAREWARWGLYGFVFYVVLGILMRLLLSSPGPK